MPGFKDIIPVMRPKFIFLVLIFTVISSLCFCMRNTAAETPDNEKGFSLEAFDLPARIVFNHYAFVPNLLVITLIFSLLPQQFLINYIGTHEKSPPFLSPAASF